MVGKAYFKSLRGAKSADRWSHEFACQNHLGLRFWWGRGIPKSAGCCEKCGKKAGIFKSSIELHLKLKKMYLDDFEHKIKERYIQKFIKQ